MVLQKKSRKVILGKVIFLFMLILIFLVTNLLVRRVKAKTNDVKVLTSNSNLITNKTLLSDGQNKVNFISGSDNIIAKLINPTAISAESEQEVQVKYTVQGESADGFIVNNPQEPIKDVAILIDNSSSTKNELDQVKNGIRNDILNAFSKWGKDKDIRIDVISYNSVAVDNYVDPSTVNDYRNAVQQKIDSVTSCSTESGNYRNLGAALNMANEFLTKQGRTDSIKTILIVAGGNPTDTVDNTTVSNIKNSGYNVVTLAVESADSPDKDSIKNFSNVYQWHNNLGGNDSTYFLHTGDVNAINNETIPKKVVPKLSELNTMTYEINNAKLTFDLNGKFEPISTNLTKTSVDNQYSINIPEVKFKQVAYDSSTGNATYKADPVDVTFSIKSLPYKFGELYFGDLPLGVNKNNISFTNNKGESIVNLVETPIIKVIAAMQHGIYNGFVNNSASVTENDIILCKKASATFAGVYGSINGANNITLQIDANISNINGDIRIYSYNEQSTKLNYVASMQKDKSIINKYSFDMKNFRASSGKTFSDKDKLVVIYNLVLPDKECTITNSFNIDGKIRDVNATIKGELPDLF